MVVGIHFTGYELTYLLPLFPLPEHLHEKQATKAAKENLFGLATTKVYKANNVPNQPAASQTGLPPVPAQQGSQQAFGGYPHLNPQYGGLGGLGTHHQTGASQTHHQGGGYGNYGAGFGTNYYGNTGRGGGWGGSYYTGKG
ncbi:uncharacterized protein CIMG_13277 [Coccidioides immitis RS]|uniref:Uncharacterized protein n=1 Tax=Coccidioides immitis (strain RS) TaxID=246410 RepID=A0A0D8JUN8_COCIM|nr:uncharacterized protein CIMG_13277 [Coccidioides immitis RS]KJF60854.1 hypothetical protein CIMG_13277 [Coccidioides immitis RS]TPX22651.1 RNAPII degradation factor [Coccidioides immitis]